MTTIQQAFDKIYQAAIKQDVEALNAVLDQGYSIQLVIPFVDQNNNNMFGSPVYKLAFENNQSAVEFLLKHGASKDIAAEGFASAGNIECVEKLLEENVDLDRNGIVHGYAYAGKTKQVNKLLDEGADISSAAHGYAWGGYFPQVEELRELGADVTHIAHGYACAGYFNKLTSLLNKGVDLEAIKIVYAQFNYREKLWDFPIAKNEVTLHAMGYASAGDVKRVNECLLAGADKSLVVMAYARAGNTVEVNKLMQNVHIVDAVYGYASGGHFKQVNALIEAGASIFVAAVTYEENGYKRESTELLKSFSKNELNLHEKIITLRKHGEDSLKKGHHKKGNDEIKLAGDLLTIFNQYKKNEIDAPTMQENISNIIRSKMHEMGKNRNAKDIAGHFFLGLTGVGLGAMLYNKYHTKSKSMFFNSTKRQKTLGFVNDYADKIVKDVKKSSRLV